MNIVPFLLFCSLCLVALSVLFFVYLFKQDEYDQADRMALAPLRDDTGESTPKSSDEQFP